MHFAPRVPRGLFAAVVIFFALALPAAGASTLGVSMYTDEYCMYVDGMLPPGAAPGDVLAAHFASPVTLECRTGSGVRRRHDPGPLLWVVAVWGGTVALSAALGGVFGGLESRKRVRGPWD